MSESEPVIDTARGPVVFSRSEDDWNGDHCWWSYRTIWTVDDQGIGCLGWVRCYGGPKRNDGMEIENASLHPW